jgi:hypothetical protein
MSDSLRPTRFDLRSLPGGAVVTVGCHDSSYGVLNLQAKNIS